MICLIVEIVKSYSCGEGAVFAYPVACGNSRIEEKHYAGDYFISFERDFCRDYTFLARFIINCARISGCKLYAVLEIEDYAINCVGVAAILYAIEHYVTNRNFAFDYFTACFRLDYAREPIELLWVIVIFRINECPGGFCKIYGIIARVPFYVKLKRSCKGANGHVERAVYVFDLTDAPKISAVNGYVFLAENNKLNYENPYIELLYKNEFERLDFSTEQRKRLIDVQEYLFQEFLIE